MELRHLRYFVAVAEHGGFGRSSRALHVSQSAISERVHDLEEELGIKLFHRSTNRISLTRQGKQFLEDSKAILAMADKAVDNAQKSVRGEIGSLTIAFFVGGTGTFFSPMIREFRERFPGVQVSVVEMPSGIQHHALQTGKIDIGFTRTLPPVYANRLQSITADNEPLYAVMLRKHRLAQKRSISIQELADERFVLTDRENSPAVFDKVINLCSESGFSPRIGAYGSVSAGVVALVEAGEGVAILPQGARILGSDDITFVRLSDPGATLDITIAWSAAEQNPIVRSFIALARERLQSPKR